MLIRLLNKHNWLLPGQDHYITLLLTGHNYVLCGNHHRSSRINWCNSLVWGGNLLRCRSLVARAMLLHLIE